MRTIIFFCVASLMFLIGESRNLATAFQKVTGKQVGDTSCVKLDINEYLDNVLERARQELPDPLRLPPRSTFVELSDGVTWSMSTLLRKGKAHVNCNGTTVLIKILLTVDELKGRYTWTKNKWRRHWEGYVTFLSNDFEADIDLVIEKHDGEVTHPRLEKMEIKKFKDAKIEITGMGLFTWALGEMTTRMSGIFQKTIANAVQDPLKEALERHMREIDIK